MKFAHKIVARKPEVDTIVKTQMYSRINSTKSPASHAGNVYDTRLIS